MPKYYKLKGGNGTIYIYKYDESSKKIIAWDPMFGWEELRPMEYHFKSTNEITEEEAFLITL